MLNDADSVPADATGIDEEKRMISNLFDRRWRLLLKAWSDRTNSLSGWCHAVAGGIFVAVLSKQPAQLSLQLKFFLAAVSLSAFLGLLQRILDKDFTLNIDIEGTNGESTFRPRYLVQEEINSFVAFKLHSAMPKKALALLQKQMRPENNKKSNEHKTFERVYFRAQLMSVQLCLLVISCILYGSWLTVTY